MKGLLERAKKIPPGAWAIIAGLVIGAYALTRSSGGTVATVTDANGSMLAALQELAASGGTGAQPVATPADAQTKPKPAIPGGTGSSYKFKGDYAKAAKLDARKVWERLGSSTRSSIGSYANFTRKDKYGSSPWERWKLTPWGIGYNPYPLGTNPPSSHWATSGIAVATPASIPLAPVSNPSGVKPAADLLAITTARQAFERGAA